MYSTRSLLLALAVIMLLSLHASAGVPDSIAYQGRLTESADTPVPDGNRDLILSIWSDSIGGTMLHSEFVTVSTSSGLFSTCIGCASSSFADIFTGQSLYLQIQIPGQAPMLPRTRLRNVPSSISSSSLHGETVQGAARARGIITTKPSGSTPHGIMVLDADSDGDGHPEFVVTDSVSPTQSVILIGHDFDDDGALDIVASESVDASSATRHLGHSQGANTGILTSRAGADSTELSISQSTPDGSASASLKGKNIRKNITVNLRSASSGSSREVIIAADSAAAVSTMTADLDGDGLAENAVSSSSNDSSSHVTTSSKFAAGPRQTTSMDGSYSHAAMRCVTDNDDDGVAENSVEASSSSSRAALAIKTKGTGAQRFSNTSDCDDTDAASVLEADLDGDGAAEISLDDRCDGTSARTAYTGRSGSTTGTIRMMASPDSASSVTGTDADNDGKMESTVHWQVDATGPTVSMTRDLDNDGVTEREFTVDAQGPTISARLSGRSGSTTGTIRMAATDSSASSGLDADSDGDGLSERWIVDRTGPTISSRIIAADLDADGVADRTIGEVCDDNNASISIDEPGVHISMSSGGASGAAEISIDEPGVHVAVARKGWDGTIKGNFHIDNGGARTVNFDGDGKGYMSSSLMIGTTSDSLGPISHSSGAYLSAGGTWTNASDANLKENFQPVDGEQILEKIEQLPITEWNYKNESDDVKHIGPTAQDFKEVFGVGSNDQSISTIDPSGIALAAIKQLKKENAELKKQVEELSSLKAEVEQLKKLLTEEK